MKFNFNEVYQIESGASQKKIYRFKNKDKEGVVVDFSYNYKDFDSFLEVNKLLSTINISIPKIFDIDESKHFILQSGHPSFAHSHKKWFNNNHFSKTNNYLINNSLDIIDW